MVTVDFEAQLKQRMKKVKDIGTKNKIKKQIDKIINNPEIGKPMRYNRKGTRELYISPFRLSYIYLDKENKIVFLDLYHKDEQ